MLELQTVTEEEDGLHLELGMLKSADEFSDVRFCIADMKKLLDLANMSGPHICESE